MWRNTTAHSRSRIHRGQTLPRKIMPDAIPEEEKSRRLAALQAKQRQIQQARHDSLVGAQFEVLVDGRHESRDQWAGRTSCNRILNFTSSEENLLGEYVSARVTRAGPNSLQGEHVTRS